MDDQQPIIAIYFEGCTTFKVGITGNKIPGKSKYAKIKYLKNMLYKDYDIIKLVILPPKKDKDMIYQVEFDNKAQYNCFIGTEFQFTEDGEPIKFSGKDETKSAEKVQEK